jgi:hypothetical protein
VRDGGRTDQLVAFVAPGSAVEMLKVPLPAVRLRPMPTATPVVIFQLTRSARATV